MNQDSTNQRRLYPVVTYSSALAFGTMIASLEALRMGAAGITFQLTYRTFIAFVLGGAIVVPFWRLIFHGSSLSRRKLTLLWIAVVAVLVLLGIGAFLYPLRYVPREKLQEITTGLVTAVCALSGVAFLLWGVKRFVDSDQKQEDLIHPPEKSDSPKK
jgi:hypothetical protein